MVMAGTLTLEKRCVRSEAFPYDGKLVNNTLSMGPEEEGPSYANKWECYHVL